MDDEAPFSEKLASTSVLRKGIVGSAGLTELTLGTVVSTLKLRCAGFASTLEASSTALPSKRCAPSLRLVRFAVVLMLAVDHPPKSSWYWYLSLAVVVRLSEPVK